MPKQPLITAKAFYLIDLPINIQVSPKLMVGCMGQAITIKA